MKLITKNKSYPLAGLPTICHGEARFPLEIVPSIGTTVELRDDGGFSLATLTVADYQRAFMDGTTLVLTNTPEPVPPHAPTAQEQITEKKAALTATDYKIIKCSECSLAGVPLPYDVAALHGERQSLRDAINALETAK